MMIRRNDTEVKALLQNLREFLDAVNKNSTDVTKITSETTTPPGADDYDHDGAMKFIVCTVVVYAVMGVFFSLLVKIKRKTSANYLKNQDDLVSKFLKMEKQLKFEGDKRHMRNEIQKHAEGIARFEEKMRLLELEREIELDKQMSEAAEAHRKRHSKKDKKRRLSFSFMPARRDSSFHGSRRKMSMMDNTLGKLGFSFLFMGDSNANSKTSLQSIGEIEETDLDQGLSSTKTTSVQVNELPEQKRERRSHQSSRRLASESDDPSVEMQQLPSRYPTPEAINTSDDGSATVVSIESPKRPRPIIPIVRVSHASLTSDDSSIPPIDGINSSYESVSGGQNSLLHATQPNYLSSSL